MSVVEEGLPDISTAGPYTHGPTVESPRRTHWGTWATATAAIVGLAIFAGGDNSSIAEGGALGARQEALSHVTGVRNEIVVVGPGTELRFTDQVVQASETTKGNVAAALGKRRWVVLGDDEYLITFAPTTTDRTASLQDGQGWLGFILREDVPEIAKGSSAASKMLYVDATDPGGKNRHTLSRPALTDLKYGTVPLLPVAGVGDNKITLDTIDYAAGGFSLDLGSEIATGEIVTPKELCTVLGALGAQWDDLYKKACN